MIADLIKYKKPNSIKQSYFKLPKDVRLNSTHIFIVKIPNKRELQQIALNHSLGIGFKILLRSTKNLVLNHIPF